MRLEVVRIGNSRGIRIPKAILKQCGFDEAVEARVERGRLVIEPSRGLRSGWREAFETAGSSESDALLLETEPNVFDQEEWTW